MSSNFCSLLIFVLSPSCLHLVATHPPTHREAAYATGAGYLDIKDLFNQFDVNKNGCLDHAEMMLALRSLGGRWLLVVVVS
jgi:hypothetical protein